MVRRRSKNVSKSRAKPRALNRSDGKLKRWEKLSDIPLDEEDQCKPPENFHLNFSVISSECLVEPSPRCAG
jgi:hypothetical protein